LALLRSAVAVVIVIDVGTVTPCAEVNVALKLLKRGLIWAVRILLIVAIRVMMIVELANARGSTSFAVKHASAD